MHKADASCVLPAATARVAALFAREAAMKIDIHISDATPAQLIAIAKAMGVKLRNKGKASGRTDDAPYGKKKDGTPRKKPGRPAYKFEL